VQTILIDADDTLWENNVYFERAIERFYDLLGATVENRGAIRERINHEERRIIAEFGYGLLTFEVALQRSFLALTAHEPRPDGQQAIRTLAQEIADEPIAMLDGVEATLHYLAGRHQLVLMTKGDYAEQTTKLRASGLEPLFERVFVVAEKHAPAYEAALRQLGAPPDQSWMVGNSPRSDINPSLEAGMNAVLIPHPQTWVLEHDEIVPRPGSQCLTLQRIVELCEYF
jgi:putative hydrolase of the HAD superfamily